MLKTLRVVCNPFAGLDHEGVPAGAFAFDPEHAAGARRWVGASIDTERTKLVPLKPTEMLKGKHVAFEPVPRQRTFYKFDLSPQTVLDTAHYRMGLRIGDIFAADEETSRKVGQLQFTPIEQALMAACEAALSRWKAAHGEMPNFELWPEHLKRCAHDRKNGELRTVTQTAAAAEVGSDQ